MSVESWNIAIEEIPDLIASEPSRENAVLLASLYAIQAGFVAQSTINTMCIENADTKPLDMRDGVLDDFSDILARYSNSRSAVDRDVMRIELKRQLDAILKELIEMRHEVHDEMAVQYFIEFREAVRLSI